MLDYSAISFFGKELKLRTFYSPKIGDDWAIFVRYAVLEGAEYLVYLSIYNASKVQKEPIRTIFPIQPKT